MKDEWGLDGRKISGQVMEVIRKIAIRAVQEKGYSPELVIDVLGLSRSCMYDWLRRYESEGIVGLATKAAPGAEAQLTEPMEVWLRETVLNSTPVEQGYDTLLWNRDILAALVHKRFGVKVTGRTISGHLKKMGLSYQKPCYRAVEQDPQEVKHFLEDKFPRIQRLAQKMGAEIAFEDEAGLGIATRSGRTWGLQGHTPEVRVTDQRGGYNVLSAVTAQGHMRYSVEAGRIDSKRYVAFLKQLLKGRVRPLILLADRASFHRSREVRTFVRANRKRIRVFFLAEHSPEMNPDEQVWEEVKGNQLGKQPIKNKGDLQKRLSSALKSLQHRTQRIISFFHLCETQYAAA